MPHNDRFFRPAILSPTWVPAPYQARRLDQQTSENLNGDAGGTWNPETPICIGGSGVALAANGGITAVCDSYSESHKNADAIITFAYGVVGIGQSFTGNGEQLNNATFYLKKTGSPTGNAVARIYIHSGTFGTSSVPGLSLATSDTFDVSALTTSFVLRSLVFSGSNAIVLNAATKYVVTFEYTGGVSLADYVTAGYDHSTEVIADSYVESNSDGSSAINSGGATARAQSFTGDGGQLMRAVFYLKKTGSPTGSAVAKIYAHSGTFGTSSIPTGAALAISDPFDVSLLTTSLALTSLTFSGANQIVLTAATHYVVALEYTGGDGSNKIAMGHDTSAPSHAGNASNYSGSWVDDAATDKIFYVYTVITPTTSALGNMCRYLAAWDAEPVNDLCFYVNTISPSAYGLNGGITTEKYAAEGALRLGDNDWPQIATPRTRKVFFPIRDVFSAYPDANAGRQVLQYNQTVPGRFNHDLLAEFLITSMAFDMRRFPLGATIAEVKVRFSVGFKPASVPASLPSFYFASFIASEHKILPTPATIAAYYNDGLPQSIVLVPSTLTTVTATDYLFQISDNSQTQNIFHSVAITFTNIIQMRPGL